MLMRVVKRKILTEVQSMMMIKFAEHLKAATETCMGPETGVGAQDGGRRQMNGGGRVGQSQTNQIKKHIHIESSWKSVCAQQF